MARIRTIKPEFFTDADVAELPPLVRLLFVAMWCQADKAGRLKDKPEELKVKCLPFDKIDIAQALQLLADAKFITRYAVDGCGYIQVRTWVQHQRPHHTEAESTIPSPPLDNGALTVRERSLREGKGRERKGKEDCPEPLTGSGLPVPLDSSGGGYLIFPCKGLGKPDWTLTQAKLEEYRESFPGINLEADCRAALQWCRDNPKRRKTPGGMPAFLARWFSKEQDRAPRQRDAEAGVDVEAEMAVIQKEIDATDAEAKAHPLGPMSEEVRKVLF